MRVYTRMHVDMDQVHVRIIVLECEAGTGLAAKGRDRNQSQGSHQSTQSTAAQFTHRRARGLALFLEGKGYRRLPLSFALGDHVFVR